MVINSLKAASVAPMSERVLAQNIVDEAQRWGWRVYRAWLSIHNPKGWPDLVLCRPPDVLFVELKSATGKVTEEQGQWIRALQACGLYATVWRPGHLEEAYSLLVNGLPRVEKRKPAE
jgi:hypothetical protein